MTKTYNGEKTASSTSIAGKTGYLHAKKLKLDSCLSPYISIILKWIKVLNLSPETLKLVQNRAGNTLELIGIGNDFLNRTQMAQQVRERIDKWDYVKLKSFCATKQIEDTTHRMGENLPAIHLTKD
jgi:hypothetical protein